MAIELRQELKILQKLILTPQLQQAIKLLQMPQIELSQTLQTELTENPFLEEASDEVAMDEFETETQNSPESDTLHAVTEDSEAPLDSMMGFSVDDYFDNRSYDGRDLGYFTPDSTTSETLDQYTSEGEGLIEHLNWQLRMSPAPDDVRQAAETVIGNIDERGYLQSTNEEMSENSGLAVELIQRAVELVQGFDPSGVGARDLKDCLVLQLRPLDLQGTMVEQIIRNNLEDVEKRRYQKIAQQYSCAIEDVKNAVKVIESLEPKPGRGMTESSTVYIRPDVYIVRDGEDFRILLNDENIPHIRINSYYKMLMTQKGALSKDEREFLEDKKRAAEWLLKSLDHRNKTIYRVTQSILTFQREFFLEGVSKLKPLNLKDVAQDLEMHESTISRATSNKYLSCEHGLYGFKYFFSSAVSADTGAVSSTSVKEIIGKIISEEDIKKPYSDQKISEMLKESYNIVVARRTVAKYREELQLPPQNMRKKLD